MKRLRTIASIVILFAAMSANVFAQDNTYTNDDEWMIYDAFHDAFWCTNKRNYKADTAQPSASHRGNGARDNDYSGCSAAIWCQAIYFDMAVNAYKRRLEEGADNTTLRKAKNRMTSVYSGEKAHYVNFDFDNCNTNNGWFVYDDIQWWTCALARAYQVSVLAGSPVNDYLTYSEKAFCRVWYGSEKVGDDGSYADPADGFSGGMFWEWQPIDHPQPHTDNGFKSACINFPTVIACCELYKVVPDDREAPTSSHPTYQTKDFYMEKAKEIYAWSKAHFCQDAFPGRVADGIHGGGPEWSNHLYNQGTYIGASCLLYLLTGEEQYLTNAREGADYVKKSMCSNKRGKKILNHERGYEQGVYAAIFAQYMKLLVYDCGQTDYLSWMEDNIQYGFDNRDTTRNIQDADFTTPVSADDIVESYGGSALPALMLMFPVDNGTGIKDIKKKEVANDNIYSLNGTRLSSAPQHGVYIQNGRKIAVK